MLPNGSLYSMDRPFAEKRPFGPVVASSSGSKAIKGPGVLCVVAESMTDIDTPSELEREMKGDIITSDDYKDVGYISDFYDFTNSTEGVYYVLFNGNIVNGGHVEMLAGIMGLDGVMDMDLIPLNTSNSYTP